VTSAWGTFSRGAHVRAGKRVRITGQLIDAGSGAHLWADHFDGSLEDIFELQEMVAGGVAGVIEPTLLNAEVHRSAQRPTDDLTAYDLYLRAIEAARSWEKEGVLRALGKRWNAILTTGPPSLTPHFARCKFISMVGKMTRRGLGATGSTLLSGRCGTPGAIPRSSEDARTCSPTSAKTLSPRLH
jgi:hypothetical protein